MLKKLKIKIRKNRLAGLLNVVLCGMVFCFVGSGFGVSAMEFSCLGDYEPVDFQAYVSYLAEMRLTDLTEVCGGGLQELKRNEKTLVNEAIEEKKEGFVKYVNAKYCGRFDLCALFEDLDFSSFGEFLGCSESWSKVLQESFEKLNNKHVFKNREFNEYLKRNVKFLDRLVFGLSDLDDDFVEALAKTLGLSVEDLNSFWFEFVNCLKFC